MNSFEIQQEYRALESLLNEIDEETGEFIHSSSDIQEYIDNLNDNRNTKLDNIERLKREKQGQILTLDDEIKRLQTKKKMINSNIDSLSVLQMLLTHGEKIETDLYKFSTRKSKSVNIYNEDDIQDKYFKIEKKPILAEIKKAIEIANKNGESFFGAEIVEKTSLTVK